jgi:hypothetical protein
MDYSTEKEGPKRRKVMSTEVFETPEPEEAFQPYAPANASARQARAGAGTSPESEGHFLDKVRRQITSENLKIQLNATISL